MSAGEIPARLEQEFESGKRIDVDSRERAPMRRRLPDRHADLHRVHVRADFECAPRLDVPVEIPVLVSEMRAGPPPDLRARRHETVVHVEARADVDPRVGECLLDDPVDDQLARDEGIPAESGGDGRHPPALPPQRDLHLPVDEGQKIEKRVGRQLDAPAETEARLADPDLHASARAEAVTGLEVEELRRAVEGLEIVRGSREGRRGEQRRAENEENRDSRCGSHLLHLPDRVSSRRPGDSSAVSEACNKNAARVNPSSMEVESDPKGLSPER